MLSIEIKAIAKINIGLRVLRKRTDGFHDLHTLFYPIPDLFDEISIRETVETKFLTNMRELNTEENLILRAIDKFKESTNLKDNYEIYCKKKIPVGAGLGGGSSDAAAVLSALNKYYENILPDDRLNELALDLGSDVPFFLNTTPSIGHSRGEILQKIRFPIKGAILLVNPGIQISTGEAFSQITPKEEEIDYSKSIAQDSVNIILLKQHIVNDFENFVFSKYPEIGDIKSKLYDVGAKFALMTGTGSTVFGIFDDYEAAESAVKQLHADYFTFISRVQ